MNFVNLCFIFCRIYCFVNKFVVFSRYFVIGGNIFFFYNFNIIVVVISCGGFILCYKIRCCVLVCIGIYCIIIVNNCRRFDV